MTLAAYDCHATEGFVETFSGAGPFSSNGVVLEGFDNPDWTYDGNGMFRDGGLWVENSWPPLSEESDYLEQSVQASGDFVHVVEIRDHVLFKDEASSGSAFVLLKHEFDVGTDVISLRVSAIQNDPDRYRVNANAGTNPDRRIVERGPHIGMSLSFDKSLSRATYRYDNNLDDNVAPIALMTLDYSGNVSRDARTTLSVSMLEAQADALIDRWSFSSLAGDFNSNGIFDADDIDLLNAEIRRGTNDPDFDIVEDGIVDEFDRNFWVHSLSNTYFGDANLDGEFNSADLVSVFQAGLYESGSEAGWAQGDWSGDGLFESGDLVVAFQDGGYKAGPREVNAVPEPSGMVLLVLGLLMASAVRSRR